MKYLLVLLSFLVGFCFQAKRSPFDTNTPSGAAINILAALKPSAPPDVPDVPISIPKNRIRFAAKGILLTYPLPNAEQFTDFSFSPSPPPNIHLDPQTGLVTCYCYITSYFRNVYTLSYKSKATGKNFSTEVVLEIYSPYVSFSNIGLFNINNKQGYPSGIEYKDRLFISFVNENSNSKLELAMWDGVNNWEIVGGSNTMGIIDRASLVVHNEKIYILYKDSYNFYLDTYDGSTYTSVDSSTASGFPYATMAVHNGNLYLFKVDTYPSLTTCINSFSNCSTISSLNMSGYIFHTLSWNGNLYLGYYDYIAPFHYLTLAKLVGNNWQTVASLNTGNPVDKITLSVYNNQIYVGWIQSGIPSTVFLHKLEGNSFVAMNGGNHLGENFINYQDISLLPLENKLYIAFSSMSNPTVRYRAYDGNLSPLSNELKENYGGCFNTQLVLWRELPILLWHEDNFSFNKRIYAKFLE